MSRAAAAASHSSRRLRDAAPENSALFSIFTTSSRTTTPQSGANSRANTPNPRLTRVQDADPQARIRQKVFDLGAQIQQMTLLFNELQSELFEQEEKVEKFPESIRLDTETGTRGTQNQVQLSLFDSIMSGDCHQVRHVLDRGDVDPNEMYQDISVNKKVFATATPVVVAALVGKQSMVQMLVAAGASVESTYSFVAGAEQQIWSGTVVHTAIPTGNLGLLKDLAELKADMNTRGSNEASLVWQACYFGQRPILEYLLSLGLSQKCLIEQRAESQDDSIVSYSPLHVAVTQGHSEIVKVLLSQQAQISVDNGKGRTPLEDAVDECHGDIVHQLILNKGDIFGQTPVKAGDFLQVQKIDTVKDKLSSFERIILTENQVLLSRVMQALAHAPSLLDNMSKQNLLQVLEAPGDAPIHLMDAIFQKQKIVFWEMKDGKTFRRQPKNAMVSTVLGMNISNGPHAGQLMKCFGDKRPLPDNFAEFIKGLLPVERTTRDQMYVPVTVYMCHIPTVHTDLRILMALTDCPNKQIFRCDGVAAIVSWAWNEEKQLSKFGMWLAVIELINFLVISVLKDETVAPHLDGFWLLLNTVNAVIGCIIWLVALLLELSQFLGYVSDHSTMKYFNSARQWFDILVLAMTGYFIIVFVSPSLEYYEDQDEFMPLLGILLFFKWFKMLVYLRQYESIAVRTLPITSTMWNVGPFLLVMAVYVFASVNMFYALQNGYDLLECFVFIYRLVVLGDFNIAHLQKTTEPSVEIAYYHFVNFMVVGLTFVIGVTMMNLFVAVLCVAYDEAAKNAAIAFTESRANIVLDQHAIRKGIKYVKKCLRRKRRRMSQGGIDCSRHSQTAKLAAADIVNTELSAIDIMHHELSHSQFLWFARPADSGILHTR